MRLSMPLSYSDRFLDAVPRVVDLEKAGLDIVWVAEAYSFDAVSQMAYLAARTDRILIGSSIVNVFSRTPALMAMTFAGLDDVSEGRVICGLGASGPQVVEGFHGVPYDRPMARVKDYIEICRKVWRREVLVHEGGAVTVPLPAEQGTGLGKPLKLINRPVRDSIPIWWASLMGRSVEATAELADGWLPVLFLPEKAATVWGEHLREGFARRSPSLGRLEVAAGGLVAIGDDLVGEEADKVHDLARPMVALYVGGMGARTKNFYNDVFRRYGYPAEASLVQDLYLAGKKEEAMAAVPSDFLARTSLVGPRSYVAERVAAYKEAGVTVLSVSPVGPDPMRTIETLREIVDEVDPS